MDNTAHFLEQALLRAALPLWMLAGLADWACHRVRRMERSAGLKESWLHLAMLAELGAGIVAALAFQPTALLLALLALACLAHELTVWWDLAYASERRVIPPYEQWVHGVQVALPWMCLAGLAIAHRDQALALVGWGSSPPDWRLRWREAPLPGWAWAAIAAGAALFVVLPFAEEHVRCRKASSSRRTCRQRPSAP